MSEVSGETTIAWGPREVIVSLLGVEWVCSVPVLVDSRIEGIMASVEGPEEVTMDVMFIPILMATKV